MKLSIRFLLLLFPVLLLLILGFFWGSSKIERSWALSDLNNRSRLVADGMEDSIVSSMRADRRGALKRVLNRVSRDTRLYGVLICDPAGHLVARSDSLPQGSGEAPGPKAAADSLLSQLQCSRAAKYAGESPGFLELAGNEIYHRATYPLKDDSGALAGYVMILHDPSYMARRGYETRKYGVLGFLLLGIIISFTTIVVYRWSVSRPIAQLSEMMKSVMSGDIARISRRRFDGTEFAPIVKNLDRVLLELRKAKTSVFDSIAAAWSPERLRHEVQRLFGSSRLCVVANREPYIHNKKGSKLEILFPASGLVSAVEPIVRACSGLWIGHGSGTADRETADKNGVLLVPPGKAEYALKRVWMTREEEQGYYYGFSNEGLWPLCHIAHTRPIFRRDDWEQYQKINARFADAFDEEMKSPRPIALIQDYHFALLPGLLREKRPDAVTSLFWHIPWPNPEVIGICPWKNDILKGMLGADLIGFHTQYHCNNFLDTVDRFLEARVERDTHSVTFRGHKCYVKPFPISIEWPPREDVAPEEIPAIRTKLFDELSLDPEVKIGIGVDRLDYTKGIIERFLAVERLLEKHPEWVGKFTFIQIGAPSRTHIKRYQDLNSEVQEVADRINWKFHSEGADPIMLRLAHHDATEVFRYYRAADVCFVSSLHDGMNLVAKEYIASRSDMGGALVLSSFTGAARELRDALIVNPYDVDESADALQRALTMSTEERNLRMSRLRSTVASNNVYYWAGQFLAEIHTISEDKEARRARAARRGKQPG